MSAPAPPTTARPPNRLRAIGRSYQEAIAPLARHPAPWTFAGLTIAAALYLVLSGHGADALSAGMDLGTLAILVAITIPITAGGKTSNQLTTGTTARGRLWAQTAVLLVFTFLIFQFALNFHGVAPSWLRVLPVWTGLVNALIGVGQHLGVPYTVVTNPVLYVVLPGAALLALGARWKELGFGRGYRVLVVIVIWSFAKLTELGGAFFGGQMSLATLGLGFLSQFSQAGFVEEFLYRGALMTRLVRLLGVPWGVVLASLLFGVPHLGLDTQRFGGDYLAGLADTIINQGIAGVGFCFVFLRTRNLVAPTIIHTIGDMFVG